MPSDNMSVMDSWERHAHTHTRTHTLRCANTHSECFWTETESDSDRIYYDGISKAAITALADWKAIRTHLPGCDQCSHPDTSPHVNSRPWKGAVNHDQPYQAIRNRNPFSSLKEKERGWMKITGLLVQSGLVKVLVGRASRSLCLTTRSPSRVFPLSSCSEG